MKFTKFTFDETYFQDETIDGFFVSEAMKRYWAATLRSVEIFDEICRRHNLTYWADWGTLLGAYRHKGFVPWDDDLDLGMTRQDYLTFLSVAEAELPDGYVVDVYDNAYYKYSGFAVVTNHLGTLFDEALLNEYSWCPFPVGFDLYVYDFCPRDRDEQQKWRLDGIRYLLPMELLRTKGVSDKETKRALKEVGITSELSEDDRIPLLREFGQKTDAIAGRYGVDEADKIIQYTYFIRDNYEPYLRKEWFDEFTEVPFMSGSVPMPNGAKEILTCFYGENFMQPVIGRMAHAYPLYRRDMKAMIDFLKKGGLSLADLPPELQYIKREAELREIPY